MTLAEIFWNAYVRSDNANISSHEAYSVQLADLAPEHQTAIETGCAAVEEHVLAAAVCPHGEHGQDPAASEPVRYAKVEQMGYRSRTGTVRELEFAGRKMLELTLIPAGTVHLVSPDSIYEITWLTKNQAERATGTGAHAPAAIGRGDPDPWAGDPLGDDEDDDRDDPKIVDPDHLYSEPIFRGHTPGCACLDCEGARRDAVDLEQHARDMAAEDGDFDDCEPTL